MWYKITPPNHNKTWPTLHVNVWMNCQSPKGKRERRSKNLILLLIKTIVCEWKIPHEIPQLNGILIEYELKFLYSFCVDHRKWKNFSFMSSTMAISYVRTIVCGSRKGLFHGVNETLEYTTILNINYIFPYHWEGNPRVNTKRSKGHTVFEYHLTIIGLTRLWPYIETWVIWFLDLDSLVYNLLSTMYTRLWTR